VSPEENAIDAGAITAFRDVAIRKKAWMGNACALIGGTARTLLRGTGSNRARCVSTDRTTRNEIVLVRTTISSASGKDRIRHAKASELANSPNFSLELETFRVERYRYAVSSGTREFLPIRFAARYRASPALNFLPLGTTVSPAAE